MINNDLLRKAVRVEYTLLRTPLAMLDERVVSRYTPRGSVVQTSLTRTIGVLDSVAERLLKEPSAGPGAPGAAESVPTDTEPTDSVATDSVATDTVPTDVAVSDVAATPVAPAADDEAVEPRPLPPEEQEDIEELAEDLLAAEEEQTFAGELAEDDELRRVQAELRAKHTVEEHDESS